MNCFAISADADVADIYEQYEQQIEKFKEVKIRTNFYNNNNLCTKYVKLQKRIINDTTYDKKQ